MRKYILPAFAAGSLAVAVVLPVPATAQDDAMSRRGSSEFERGYRQGQAEERQAREAYERGYRQGQMEEREGRAPYSSRRLPYEQGRYGWGGEERFEREGLLGGLFGERETGFGD